MKTVVWATENWCNISGRDCLLFSRGDFEYLGTKSQAKKINSAKIGEEFTLKNILIFKDWDSSRILKRIRVKISDKRFT